jgi:demethylmenaquinone methyltransferase/2-methoxy-6-polyprenyl-1,4-benzoquinol methylase
MPEYSHDTVVPFKDSEQTKKQQVAGMFDDIAPRYDFLNRFLSGGTDILWRKKLIAQLRDVDGFAGSTEQSPMGNRQKNTITRPVHVLDVATGTGDVAIMTWNALHPEKITGIDISEGMLEIGRQKIHKQLLNKHIELKLGDSEAIKAENDTFHAVTVAFGVRNFENLEKGLSEIYRVLKPGGKLAVLEFSRPRGLFKWPYNLYMEYLAPGFGKLFSKNKDAYKYLHSSVKAFPEGETFLHILHKTGFTETSLKRLSLGICTIYCGRKMPS